MLARLKEPVPPHDPTPRLRAAFAAAPPPASVVKLSRVLTRARIDRQPMAEAHRVAAAADFAANAGRPSPATVEAQKALDEADLLVGELRRKLVAERERVGPDYLAAMAPAADAAKAELAALVAKLGDVVAVLIEARLVAESNGLPVQQLVDRSPFLAANVRAIAAEVCR